MPIPLPNLDDRRFTDLVEEGRALIPVLSPEWTDHNASDPGITLLELFAFIAEQDAYRINRVSDRHRLRLLALAGVAPRGPKPARVLLQLQPVGASKLGVPPGVRCSGGAPEDRIEFRTLRPMDAAPSAIEVILLETGSGFQNLSWVLQRGELPYLFGSEPAAGAFVYFGFNSVPEAGVVSVGFLWSGDRTGEIERQRILAEAGTGLLPPHHSVRLQWEAVVTGAGGSQWTPVAADDNTRSLTLNGTVQLTIPAGATTVVLSHEPARFYVRCRISSGAFDRPPRLAQAFLNAVEAEQAIPATSPGPIPKGTDPASITLPDPSIVLGAATGQPFQKFRMPGAPVVAETVTVYSLETSAGGTAWRQWEARGDLIASGPADAHFVLDPARGEIALGDGHHGRVAPAGSLFASSYRTTHGAAGQVGANGITTVDEPGLSPQLSVINPGAADGAADAETLAQTIGRAIDLREARLRAMTTEDIRTLALETPGTVVGRAEVKPNFYPGLNCVNAPGLISVFVLPDAPGKRPQPSAGLLSAVAARLNQRRIVGTRFVILGPDYVTVTVQAKVKALPYTDRAQVTGKVKAALNGFFDPLTGGPNGAGWPLGRDVYRSEVLQVIDSTAGVDHVLSLELIANTCGQQCGNLCLGPTTLVASGTHEIEVA